MTAATPLVRSHDRQPIRYLVVDDSLFARKALAQMITGLGGAVVAEAGDGCTAVTEYLRARPDIVLLDIVMPRMEGIEAAECILQQDPNACIVMVSSVGHQHNIVVALQKGARYFLQKPVKPEMLEAAVKYVLGAKASPLPLETLG